MNYVTDDFDYDLPSELIAQYPLTERSASRLLALDIVRANWQHRQFTDLISLLKPNDIVVLNDTRVIPARLFGHKASGGAIECLLERLLADNQVLAHIRASRAPKPGGELILAGYRVTVLSRETDLFRLQFPEAIDLLQLLDEAGQMPLPPYIERKPEGRDKARYQTVFAKTPGAVAAPTAGLHFDQAMLDQLAANNIAHAYVTLHVGAGTFQPVRTNDLAGHHMHSEWLSVPKITVEKIEQAKAKGGRVVAIGTTVLRSLETAAAAGVLSTYEGDTDLFIRPGFKFNCVDVLLTNFHLPRSTLLMLVAAFGGYELVMQAYQAAISEAYRFFSYGDAMLLHAC
ncbi:MAG: tRNA preQ1(34) S-adenosylmethionine ribosyltransferase-isomerase QueA [Gammaproteobacteria bacterium]|nr:tRNA preQ1(34) S-adenosylmethionine ribosyltransferase-isomerase QueA [Gammaproteobacteria bacterium]